MSDNLPTRIGAYRIVTKLGEGGMAKVYLGMALKGRFRKLVVVKLMSGECASIPEAREMFLEEAELAARLNNPNVVSTFEVGEDELGQFIAMEYLEGQTYGTLLRKLGRGNLALAHHIDVLIQVLAGLHYAHEFVDYDGTPLGIVHRDVTPQNVFLTYDGLVKLVDFGVAKAACQNHETRAGVIKGKLAYLAPEQATAAPLDRRADIFAVGVMLWEALAGRRLASGHLDVAVIHNRVHGLEPRIREVVPDAPTRLAEICDRAMALRAEDRFSTAREMADALQEALEELPGRAALPPLGALVSETFAAERSELRTTIEQHTRSTESGVFDRSSVSTLPRPDMQRVSSTLGPSAADATDANAAAAVPEPTRPGVAKRRLALFAAVALLAVIGAAALERRSVGSAPASASAQATSGASAPLASASPSASPSPGTASGIASARAGSIDVALSATPSQAVLTIDGVTVDANPFRAKVDRDERMHVVRATAPGYAAAERAVSFAADVDVALTLTRAVEPLHAGTTAVTTGAIASSAKSSATAASPPPAATTTARATPQAGDDLRAKSPAGRRTIDDKDPYSQ
jgi:serine/threonine-protein kinase